MKPSLKKPIFVHYILVNEAAIPIQKKFHARQVSYLPVHTSQATSQHKIPRP
ncbi:hypothetical protein TRIP_C60099 [Candidatus Zixiibacteriota bacterium]|nr:hypothetical protein TRIP_C60099 [candidate division Zixibacteria bacterium]